MENQLDLWISSAAGSLAKTLALQEPEPASAASAPGCGLNCGDSCARCGPLGLSLRTLLLYELEALTGCCATWRKATTRHGRSWWVLMTSEPHTGASESGLSAGEWPTATAGDAKASGSRTAEGSEAHAGISLTDVVVHGLVISDTANRQVWATPAAAETRLGYQRRPEGMASQQNQQSLTTEVLDTVSPLDVDNPSGNGKPRESSLMLNADWVLQLMGFPRTWARLSTVRD